MIFSGWFRGLLCVVALLAVVGCEQADVAEDGPGVEVPDVTPIADAMPGADTAEPSAPDVVTVVDEEVTEIPEPDASVPSDCEPGTGCLGEPCEGPEDCLSELCVDHMGGQVCSKTCDSECPQGWSCREVTMGGSDVAFICLSDHANLCRPCAETSDCVSAGGVEDACVLYGTWQGGAGADAGLEGRFCASSCGADADCPVDFSCREVTTAEGNSLVRCVRSEGDCPCASIALDLALQTPCERTGEHGICQGVRQCTDAGLTACDAPEPGPETCNGIDDDCDGDQDEETCPNDNPCVVSTCGGGTGCQSELLDGVPCQNENLCMPDAICVDGVCEGESVDCEDGNPCTDDHCDDALGCVHTYTENPCDDEDPCTLADACQSGVCQGGYTLDCECQVDAECLPQEDGDLCNGTLFCDLSSLPYRCEVNPESVKTCEELSGPGSQCQEMVCVPGSGACVAQTTNEGGLCDDGNACTVNATCTDGVCDGGEAISCDDQNPCTDDGCDPDASCTYSPNTQPCDDGDVCTVQDGCLEGGCVGGVSLGCDDQNPCTASECLPDQGCVQEPADGPCDDGNSCTTGDICADGLCVGVGSLACDDDNPCTYDECLTEGGCAHTPSLGSCSDGDPCTVGETCAEGACVGANQVNCDDENPCTDDACGPDGLCVHVDFDGQCDDGNACTYGDHCAQGACVPEGADSCDDENPCTTDGCTVTGGCEHAANELPCNDLDVCTTVDLCAGGTCVGGNPLGCDDQNPCTEDLCQVGFGCTHQPTDGACDDKNPCTLDDHCALGGCVGGASLGCDDQNPCTVSDCLPDQGCVQEPADGPCDDGNSCTTGDICAGGLCVGVGSLACDDDNPCTYDECLTEGGCAHTPSLGACSDGDPCTVGETCAEGACVGANQVDCDDDNPCTDDACGPDGLCVHVDFDGQCDDGNACTYGDHCAQGACVPAGADSCDDENPCTTDGCTVTGGCEHTANELPCNDLDVCTTVDLCAGGTCVGGNPLGCDDQNPCTEDLCQVGFGCTHQPTDGACDDKNPCTLDDHCTSGACLPGSALPCDDQNPCTDDICEPDEGCVHLVNQAPCNDGSACTTSDTCAGGVCAGELSDECQDYNPCTDDACDDDLGCLHTANDAPCDDLNSCTTNDQCVNGFCKPISSVDCNDGNGCTDDSCEPDVGCIHTANAAPCDDGDVCTAFDKCADSGCFGGTALNCNDGDPCSVDLCDPVDGCYHQASTAPCDDLNPCTVDEFCSGGSCQGGQPLSCTDGAGCLTNSCDPTSGCITTPDDSLCDDNNICTAESCGAGGGCVTTFNNGLSCDDGNAATVDDACSAGVCAGVVNVCGANLKEDPQQTKPGWTLCYLDSSAPNNLQNASCSSLFSSAGRSYGCWHSHASFPHENANGSVDNACKAGVQNSTSYSAWGGNSHILTVCIQN